ncbi:hypothetical protein [Cytobacillus gottheilii]|uniref:Uncharacterized protein n=1 Tax=Cytobacillus gottheilii TaxID=859144 RepID=A0ABX8FDU0_9BACI|nr:hypothetical protein [Cytobacillus gottheilii]QVY62017.1 hypothetical protein J1899_02545 [Cytobacillus gottheilii]
MNLGAYREDPLADNIIYLWILPSLAILGFMFYPEAEPIAVFIGSAVIFLMIVLSVLMKIKKWHYYLGFRGLATVIYLDLTSVFMALTIIRAGGGVVISSILLVMLILTIFIALRFPNFVLTEANEPRTKIGKTIVSFAYLGSAAAAAIGYWSVNGFGASLVLTIVFVLFLIVIALAHASFRLTLKRSE